MLTDRELAFPKLNAKQIAELTPRGTVRAVAAGEVLFAEHGLAPDRNVQRLQRAVQPLWKSMTGGCHLTRAADRLLEDAGFRVEQLHKGYAPGPKFAAFMYRGFAVRP